MTRCPYQNGKFEDRLIHTHHTPWSLCEDEGRE